MPHALPRRRSWSPAPIAAVAVLPLLALTFACLESAALVAAGQFIASVGLR